MSKVNPVLEFLGAGYRIDTAAPYHGAKIKVVTEDLNIYTCTYLGHNEVKGSIISGGELMWISEKIIAWKYITIKDKKL